MRAEKQLLLDEIKENIEESDGFIVTSYQKFSAMRAREFRDVIAENGGEFKVVRKRVFSKAAEECGHTFECSALKGHVGIVLVKEDATTVVKQTVDYGKNNEDSVSVLGGFVDNELCSAEELVAIAKLPSLKELRASLLGLFEAPMSQTVAVMQSVLTSVLYCIEEKSKKE